MSQRSARAAAAAGVEKVALSQLCRTFGGNQDEMYSQQQLEMPVVIIISQRFGSNLTRFPAPSMSGGRGGEGGLSLGSAPQTCVSFRRIVCKVNGLLNKLSVARLPGFLRFPKPSAHLLSLLSLSQILLPTGKASAASPRRSAASISCQTADLKIYPI